MKYSGTIGYSDGQVETYPDSGVWKDVVVERHAYGDVLRNNVRTTPGDQAPNDKAVGATLSVKMDPYAREHFSKILYAKWMGIDWIVSTAQNLYPNLHLTLGGEYHGPTAEAPDTVEVSDGE